MSARGIGIARRSDAVHAACSSPHRCDAKCIHNSAEATCCACVLMRPAGEENGYVQGTCKCGRHVGSSPASSRASRIGPPGGRFYACFHSSQTSGCSETIESVRNPPETGWDGLGCFPAVVRWSQTVTSTCGGPAVGRARGLPKFYNKCCRFYNKL